MLESIQSMINRKHFVSFSFRKEEIIDNTNANLEDKDIKPNC